MSEKSETKKRIKDMMDKAKKKMKIAAISIFMLPPILNSQHIQKDIEIKMSTESIKPQKLAMEKTDKIPKPRYFYEDFEKSTTRKKEIERKMISILNAKQIDAYSALRIIQKIDMSESIKEESIKIIEELIKLEEEGKIRTTHNISILLDEDDTRKAEEEIKRMERIPYAVSITYYPDEKAIILHFLQDIELKTIKIQKGDYVIIEKNGIKIENK
ncbi:MAG: hypothetical protein QXT40_03405 [Candidatus Micrarchaeia archaeon]